MLRRHLSSAKEQLKLCRVQLSAKDLKIRQLQADLEVLSSSRQQHPAPVLVDCGASSFLEREPVHVAGTVAEDALLTSHMPAEHQACGGGGADKVEAATQRTAVMQVPLHNGSIPPRLAAAAVELQLQLQGARAKASSSRDKCGLATNLTMSDIAPAAGLDPSHSLDRRTTASNVQGGIAALQMSACNLASAEVDMQLGDTALPQFAATQQPVQQGDTLLQARSGIVAPDLGTQPPQNCNAPLAADAPAAIQPPTGKPKPEAFAAQSREPQDNLKGSTAFPSA